MQRYWWFFYKAIQYWFQGYVKNYIFFPLQKRYLRVTVNEQPRTQINSSEQVFPFDQLFPFLISLIEPDKAIRLQTLFDQYKVRYPQNQFHCHSIFPLFYAKIYLSLWCKALP
jgi:hypothetical protein